MLLIFCEVAPKTFGALHPERLALPAAYIYTPLLWLLYPFVWATNLLANGVLRLFGVSRQLAANSLSSEELRTVVAEAGAMIPHRHQQMLVSILDLEHATVEDIMVPRNEIVGIDVDDDWDRVVEHLRQSQHTRLPLYQGEIDRIIGVLHMKQVVHELARGRLDRDALIEAAGARETYFVPSGTTLNTQLLNFQRNKRRMAFVVDEYGDIQGLVTLEDILEEIVGEFTTDPATMMHKDVHADNDGSYVANGSATIRALNQVHALESAHGRTQDPERPDRGVLGDHPGTRHHPEIGGLHAGGAANRRQRHQDGADTAAGAGSEGLECLIQARHSDHRHTFGASLRHIRGRHHRRFEAVFCRLAQAFLAEGHRPDLACQPEFAERDQRMRHRRIAQARACGHHDGQIRRGLRQAHAADDVRETHPGRKARALHGDAPPQAAW